MQAIARAFSSVLDASMRRRLRPFEPADWSASAVVFAPHPDDETLGCGGVACKKIASGAQVRFVFVTDGSRSHPKVPPRVLSARRREEAACAVRRLGGSEGAIEFLDFPDQAAQLHCGEIARAAEALLRRWRPRSVYVPHAKDGPADHSAVTTSVRAALHAWHQPVTVFEYPIWYWYHWPRVRLRGDLPGMWRTTVRQTIVTLAGLRSVGDFNTQAYVGDVLPQKNEALAAHASQMIRPPDETNWPTLGELSSGEFLRRLLGEYETFMRYEV